jgi:hypothetical protein
MQSSDYYGNIKRRLLPNAYDKDKNRTLIYADQADLIRIKNTPYFDFRR